MDFAIVIFLVVQQKQINFTLLKQDILYTWLFQKFRMDNLIFKAPHLSQAGQESFKRSLTGYYLASKINHRYQTLLGQQVQTKTFSVANDREVVKPHLFSFSIKL